MRPLKIALFVIIAALTPPKGWRALRQWWLWNKLGNDLNKLADAIGAYAESMEQKK